MRLGRTGLAAAALAAAAPALVPVARGFADRPAVVRAESTHPSTFYDTASFARAVARAAAAPVRPMPGARAIIVPHHWLAGSLIVGGLRDVAASGTWTRVVLIGPNHSGAGGAAVSTSEWSWTTPFGEVKADGEAVRTLLRRGLAEPRPDVLTYEHSIDGIVPAIARFLPHARLVPLALRAHWTASEVDRLAAALAEIVDERTVVVASVDFSHYLSAGEARGRNTETIAALRSLDSRRILSFGNEHVDSPPAIAAVMETVRRLGATRFELRADTNSTEFGGSTLPPVTSYITGYFR